MAQYGKKTISFDVIANVQKEDLNGLESQLEKISGLTKNALNIKINTSSLKNIETAITKLEKFSTVIDGFNKRNKSTSFGIPISDELQSQYDKLLRNQYVQSADYEKYIQNEKDYVLKQLESAYKEFNVDHQNPQKIFNLESIAGYAETILDPKELKKNVGDLKQSVNGIIKEVASIYDYDDSNLDKSVNKQMRQRSKNYKAGIEQYQKAIAEANASVKKFQTDNNIDDIFDYSIFGNTDREFGIKLKINNIKQIKEQIDSALKNISFTPEANVSSLTEKISNAVSESQKKTNDTISKNTISNDVLDLTKAAQMVSRSPGAINTEAFTLFAEEVNKRTYESITKSLTSGKGAIAKNTVIKKNISDLFKDAGVGLDAKSLSGLAKSISSIFPEDYTNEINNLRASLEKAKKSQESYKLNSNLAGSEKTDAQTSIQVNVNTVPDISSIKADIQALDAIPVNIKLKTTPQIKTLKSQLEALDNQNINVKLNYSSEMKKLKAGIESLGKNVKPIDISNSVSELQKNLNNIDFPVEKFQNALKSIKDGTKIKVEVDTKYIQQQINNAFKGSEALKSSVSNMVSKQLDKMAQEAQKKQEKQAEQERKRQEQELKKQQELIKQQEASKKEETKKTQKDTSKSKEDSTVKQTEENIQVLKKYNEELNKLRNAAAQDNSKNILTDSFKSTKDGLYQFSELVVDSENNVQKLVHTVSSIDDVLTDSGKFSDSKLEDSLLKETDISQVSKNSELYKNLLKQRNDLFSGSKNNTSVKQTEENVQAVQKYNEELTKLRNAVAQDSSKNILTDTFKSTKDGLYQFSELVIDSEKNVQKLVHTVSSVDDVLTKSGNFSKSKLESSVLSEKDILQVAQNNNLYRSLVEEKVLSMSSKTKGFTLDESTVKTSKDGIVSFIGDLERADGVIQKVKFSAKDFFQTVSDRTYVNNGGFSKKFFGEFSDYYKTDEIQKQMKDIQTLKKNLDVLNKQTDTDTNSNVASQIKTLSADLNNANENLRKSLTKLKVTSEEQDRIISSLMSSTEEYKEPARSINDRAEKLRKINKIDLNDFINTDITVNKDSTFNPYEKLKDAINKFKTIDTELNEGKYTDKDSFNSLMGQYDEYLSVIKELNVEKNKINNDFGKNTGSMLEGIDINESDLKSKSDALQNYYKELGYTVEKISQVGNEQNKFKVSLIDGNQIRTDLVTLEQLSQGVEKTTTTIRANQGEWNKVQSSGEKWLSGLKSKMSNLTQYVTGIEVVMRIWTEIQEGFSFVKDLNSLMTTIYQTSDITSQGLDDLSQGAIDKAKELGTNVEQVSGAIEVYAAYGETVDSLLNKSSPTTMLAKASGDDVKTASDQIQGVKNSPDILKNIIKNISNCRKTLRAFHYNIRETSI